MSKQAQPGAGNGGAHDGQDAAPVQDGKGNVGKIFSRPFVFLRGVPSLDFLPPEGPPEIAFAGRSNVGKSSLINALVGQKALARTSNTPGRTQELNFFAPDGYSGTPDDLPPFAIVDMPGYGFAQAPKEKVDQWTELVFDYLRGRSTLKRVFLLIDSRHGIKARDEEVLALLDAAAVSYQLVLTKTDKLKGHALARTIETAEKSVLRRPAAFPGTLSTSSQKNAGLDDLRHAILAAAGLTQQES